jgi:PilZ domain
MATSRDRRQFARRPFRARVTVSLPTPPILVEANVLDISLGGVRLICAEPLFGGQDALMTFRVRTRGGVQTEQTSGRVVHSRMDDDVWVVGLKFNEVLTAESTPILARAATGRRTNP